MGCWLLDITPATDATVDEAILALLNELPDDALVWSNLTQRFRVDLLCNVTVRGVNQGFVVSTAVIKKLASLGIELGVDIFTESDNEQALSLAKNAARRIE
jgi:hypothetical protein